MLSSTKKRDESLFQAFLGHFADELAKCSPGFLSENDWREMEQFDLDHIESSSLHPPPRKELTYTAYLDCDWFDLKELADLFLLHRYDTQRLQQKALKGCLRGYVVREKSSEEIGKFLEAMWSAFQFAQRQLPEPTQNEAFLYSMRRCGLEPPDDPNELPEVYEQACDFMRTLDRKIEEIKEAASLTDPNTNQPVPIKPDSAGQFLHPGYEEAWDNIQDLKTQQLEVFEFLHLLWVRANTFEVLLPENEFTPGLRKSLKPPSPGAKKVGRKPDPEVAKRRETLFRELRRLKVGTLKEAIRRLKDSNFRHQLYDLLDKNNIQLVASEKFKDLKYWSDLAKGHKGELDEPNIRDLYWLELDVKDYLIKDLRRHWDRFQNRT